MIGAGQPKQVVGALRLKPVDKSMRTVIGAIVYDDATDPYELSAETALALADDSSPAFVARGMNACSIRHRLPSVRPTLCRRM